MHLCGWVKNSRLFSAALACKVLRMHTTGSSCRHLHSPTCSSVQLLQSALSCLHRKSTPTDGSSATSIVCCCSEVARWHISRENGASEVPEGSIKSVPSLTRAYVFRKQLPPPTSLSLVQSFEKSIIGTHCSQFGSIEKAHKTHILN